MASNTDLNTTQNIDPENQETQIIQESFFGASFTSRSGDKTAEDILGYPIVCLYFGARSSPPCRIFTPVLINFYREVKMTNEKAFEIIYISRDKDQDGYLSFLNQMPWLAINYEDEDRIKEYKQNYGIKGIPTLVVLGSKGEMISLDGRKEIIEKGEAAFDDWMKIYEEVKLPDDEPVEGEGMGLEQVDEVAGDGQ